MWKTSGKWTKIIPVVIFVAVFISMWGCGKKEDIVAKVGNRKITTEQFKQFLVNRFRDAKGAQGTPMDRRRELLNQQIDNELIVLDAYKQGYDKMPDVTAQSEKAGEQLALQELYKREILSKFINDKMLRDIYDKQAEEVKARHIMIRVANKDSLPEVEVAKKRIDAIAQKIKAGADFAEMAKDSSEDLTSNQSGGDLGYFQWGRMVDEFQDAAFKLKVGEVSEPVLSNYGWHLIKLEDRRPVANRKSFEETKEDLEQQAQRMMGEKLRTAAMAYMDSLKASRRLQYDNATIDMVLGKLNDKSAPKSEDLFTGFTADEKAKAVARYDRGTVTLDSLAKFISANPRSRSFPDQKSLTDVVDGMLIPEFLKDKARAEGIFDVPEVKQAIQEAKEGMMVRQAEKVNVDDLLKISDDDLMAYFEKHQAEFMTEAERTVREIFIYDDEKKANDMAARAKRGDDFVALVKKYNEKKTSQGTDGLLKSFNNKMNGEMGKEAFKLAKVGEIAGPIKMGNNYSIIKLEEILPPRQKTFGEAKSQISTTLRRDKRAEIRKTWLDGVRKQNSVKIYEDKLAHLFPEDSQPKSTGGAPAPGGK
jgi:parvulin-like peptidyl-prolyl isomerase